MTQNNRKQCNYCKEIKILSDFSLKPDGKPSSAKCKKCRREETINSYGLTKEQFNDLAKNGCHSCGNTQFQSGKTRLHIDHDHKTGKTRGILCNDCNSILGLLQEDVGLMDKAMEYLNVHKNMF